MTNISQQAKHLIINVPESQLDPKLQQTLRSVQPGSLDGVQEVIEAWLIDGGRQVLNREDVVRIISEHKSE